MKTLTPLFFFAALSLASYSQNTLPTSGNVGIGTLSPQSPLEVVGRAKMGSGPLYADWTYEQNWGGSALKWAGFIGFNAFRNNNDQKDAYYGTNIYTNKVVFEGSGNGFRWLFRTTPSGVNDAASQHVLPELMRLDGAGRLTLGGTGVSNTSYKLAVAGKIAAWDEIKVFTNGSSFPDYVFDADYKLRSLEDTESYIKENHHLPEVPSAAEIAKEGMSLNGMSEILLKKVEELTLHLIEMKKESEAMKKENEELKKRLEVLENKK